MKADIFSNNFYNQLLLDNNADNHLLAWFAWYSDRKEEGTLYTESDFLPAALIVMYFQSNSKATFKEIYESFKKKYILNECDLENTHSEEERAGLGAVYDLIQNISIDYLIPFKMAILLYIHSKLYSKTEHREFGGSYRKTNAFITYSDVKTSDPELISREIDSLNDELQEILDMARDIKQNNKTFMVIEYINRIIKLNTILLRIHPFADGNGRTCRAFLNVLFKMIDLPPVYVEKHEKEEYLKALDEAQVNNNYIPIEHFYYYKICDSILELDVNNRLDDQYKKIKKNK